MAPHPPEDEAHAGKSRGWSAGSSVPDDKLVSQGDGSPGARNEHLQRQ